MPPKNTGSKSKKPKRASSAAFRNKVGKLASLSGSYMEKPGWDALVEAFEKFVGPDHIDEAIEMFLSDGTGQRPTPVDVEREARARLWAMPLADKLKMLATQQDCGDCDNTGWKSVTVKGVEASRRCDCAMGQLSAYRKEQAHADKVS